MVATTTQTVTIDRISSSGNAIAQQHHAGKTIHVPAGEVGETYDVRLVDKGGYFVAKVVDRFGEVQPRQPSIAPDTSDIGQDLLNPDRNRSRSFSTGKSITGEHAAGKELRSWMAQRKM